MNPSKILHARENRQKQILDLGKDHGIVLIKANMPGNNKNLYQSFLLVSLFFQEVKRQLLVGSAFWFESDDGPYVILQAAKDINIKDALIRIEEEHPLGRYIDLDYFLSPMQSVTRRDRQIKRRTCILCGDEVIACMRENKHTVSEVLNKVTDDIRDFLTTWVEEKVQDAILTELHLEDKFGLVTPTSSGSHKDMNYNLMRKAESIIRPYLVQMFFCGFDASSLEDAYKNAKRVGLVAEEKMFQSLGGINAYKGLIFILGFALVSTGYMLKNNQGLEDCFENIRLMAKDILMDVPTDTFGGYAYHEYRFGGARKEVKEGLPSVEAALKIYDDKTSLHQILIYLVGLSEDSVLLKRAKNINNYQYFQQLITNVDPKNLSQIKEVTNQCIAHGISIGGAADLLVTTVYIKHFINTFRSNL